MLFRRLVFLFVMLIVPFILYGQKKLYNIEFQKTTGELTSKDLYKENFGRYDGYKIPLNEGERVHFLVYTEQFVPSLVFVNPTGQTLAEDRDKDDEYATIQTLIPQSGEWILYVIGDENSRGDYYLQYGIAGASLFSIDADVDFCSEIDFLMAHAVSYFIFLGENNPEKPLFKIDSATDAYIDGHDASYNAVLYDGESLSKAEDIYESLVSKVKNCINNKWKLSNREWMKVNDYKEKYFLITENTTDEPRYIRVSLSDFTYSENHYQNKFLVDLIIGKK
ncbi:MAG: hypothetical protein A2V66_04300 [Ignavibacteria bacterium RBG_13_36_8]|nr:MAG: hypothetical protein A2V66_04300 [Ignavibacteria bacterium RBG_13_36_8]